jgi:hypothetical protein
MSMEVHAMECYMHTNVAGLNRLDLDPPTPAPVRSRPSDSGNMELQRQ